MVVCARAFPPAVRRRVENGRKSNALYAQTWTRVHVETVVIESAQRWPSREAFAFRWRFYATRTALKCKTIDKGNRALPPFPPVRTRNA